ncbi:MAG: recombination regulator RecX [Oscillospiraceae bacterium]|jgi:regulatory protein|nr:recombination regulator RecX [Oscillospiraceae bacterium]
MIVTAKKGKGNKIHISVDGEYKTTVDSDFWYSGSIRSGDDITPQELTALIRAVGFRRAYNKGIEMLARRSHSKDELVLKLAQKTDLESAKNAADKLESIGLIDDNAYAKSLAQTLLDRKGMSPYRIKQELISKGVCRETADNAVQELDINDKERIIKLLQTKFASRDFLDEKEKKRTINSLIRLGYRYSDIKHAIDEQWGEDDV